MYVLGPKCSALLGPLKAFVMYCLSRKVYVKELKIKYFFFFIFKHVVKRSHSEACSLKKCTLPYIYFAFIYLILTFGIKKERLEKSLNIFSLATNILKPFKMSRNGVFIFSIYRLFYTIGESLERYKLP